MQASAERQALDLRVSISQILTDIQQARAVVHAFSHAPPMGATWPVLTMGLASRLTLTLTLTLILTLTLASSLDYHWLPSPWLPGRAQRGRRQHDWWIKRVFKAIGLTNKALRSEY